MPRYTCRSSTGPHIHMNVYAILFDSRINLINKCVQCSSVFLFDGMIWENWDTTDSFVSSSSDDDDDNPTQPSNVTHFTAECLHRIEYFRNQSVFTSSAATRYQRYGRWSVCDLDPDFEEQKYADANDCCSTHVFSSNLVAHCHATNVYTHPEHRIQTTICEPVTS